MLLSVKNMRWVHLFSIIFNKLFLIQTDCFNYIKILLRMNDTHLYVCGTYAFSPICAYIVSVYMKQSDLLYRLYLCKTLYVMFFSGVRFSRKEHAASCLSAHLEVRLSSHTSRREMDSKYLMLLISLHRNRYEFSTLSSKSFQAFYNDP